MNHRRQAYVPLGVRRSRVMTVLWRSPGSMWWLSYRTAIRLGRWVP